MSSIPIDPIAAGQIRMDVSTMTLVQLATQVFSLGNSTWMVSPVLGGKLYLLDAQDIGDDAYNAMEVLALSAEIG